MSATFFVSVLGGAVACAEDRAEPTTHQVIIEKFKFVPETLTVKAGDRIEWINKDVVPHTATGDAGQFDTDMLSKGETGSFTATTIGELDYICAYHPTMLGKIIIEGQ